MRQIILKLYETYIFLCDELADSTTKHWPLLAKPYQIILVLGLYLLFVLKWGPKWMTNRPVFKLDKVLMIYNLIQVAGNAYVFTLGIALVKETNFKLLCQPVNYSNTAEALHERKLWYYYFILKLTDLMDTVFFVLRKKSNQISFLHVYHHAGMVLLVWGGITYLPGGHGSYNGLINMFVHIIMYSYYFLTVATPSIKKQLWIKKNITQIQIVQFMLTILHGSVLVFKAECEFPRFPAGIILPNNIFLFILFADFYINTYIKIPKAEIHTNDVKKEHINGNVGNVINSVNGKKINVNGNSVNRNNVNGFKSEKDKSL